MEHLVFIIQADAVSIMYNEVEMEEITEGCLSAVLEFDNRFIVD